MENNWPSERSLTRRLLPIWFSLALFGYELLASVGATLGLETATAAIVYRGFVASVAMAILATRLASGRIRWSIPHAMLTLFMALYTARIAAETVQPTQPLALSIEMYWIWAIGACFLPSATIAQCMIDKQLLQRMRKIVFALLACAASLSVWAAIGTDAASVEDQSGRFHLPALNPISSGHLGGSLVLISVWWFFWWAARFTEKGAGFLELGPIFYLLLLGGFLLIVSNSRGPLVAVGVALFALGALLPAGRATLLFATLLAGALGFAAISFYLELSHGYTTYSRIFEQSQIEEVNTQSRLDLYALALRSIAEAPLVGVGLEVPEQTGYPHNIVIEAALAVGLPGAMLFVLLILAAMYRAGRLVRADHESRWVFMLFVQQLVAVQFSASIAQAAQFWLLLGFMLALVHCRRQARKHSR